MFTFGREHEKNCAIRYVTHQKQADLISEVVDGVHDLLEGRITQDDLRPILSKAFAEGHGGVWEQTGSWLRKLVVEFPELGSLWIELADYSEWKVRFRTACCLSDMPLSISKTVGEKLKNDGNKKVREMTQQNYGH